ncbi:hypothetical protein CKAN_00863300 [Cinnamomum micranthum f. kanehirae]|uniref:Uncharacterized protein n=1 Tax=Cinnamomum micranthum f. kanehirae TaxID=337451 RepID=A0A443NNE3_9MAGN|nr:hypothetical protein CKAN_00863300 [Cinnamomum micranthum f. kanehirae]
MEKSKCTLDLLTSLPLQWTHFLGILAWQPSPFTVFLLIRSSTAEFSSSWEVFGRVFWDHLKTQVCLCLMGEI